jgi:hypothetical protein
MKQLLILFGFILFTALSCERYKDPIYTQEQLNGTWEALEANSQGFTEQIIITPTDITEVKIKGLVKMRFKSQDYSFNGRIIKYTLYGINFEFAIKKLTDQKLLLGYHDPIEYRRISGLKY